MNIGSRYSSSKQIEFSVPQGSCAGPVLYLAYTSTMEDVVPLGLDLHRYANELMFTANDRQAERSTTMSLEESAVDG